MRHTQLACLLLALALASARGEAIKRPSIPEAWNATISGVLINFFPFTATILQDRAAARTRLNFGLTRPGHYEGSILFDLAAGTGYFFDNEVPVANTRPLLCQPIALTPKITHLLSWAYYDDADMCGASCWQYVSPNENEKYSWIFKGQPLTLFSFEVNPLHEGSSNMISVLSDLKVGPQPADAFVIPSFCPPPLSGQAAARKASLSHLLASLASKSE